MAVYTIAKQKLRELLKNQQKKQTNYHFLFGEKGK